jgi:alpha-glucosidase
VKDADLRDNPPTTADDHPRVRSMGMRPVYNMNREEVHAIFRRWRSIADAYDPGRVLLGETWVLALDELMRFYGTGRDELHLALNFPFVFSEVGGPMREVVEETEAILPEGAWPVWFGSNHDAGRFPTIWCGGDDRRIRAALLILLTLRGTPILYYGDEIGMTQVNVPRERLRDPVGVRGWPDEPGRDVARTPMPWTPARHGGFTDATVEPWLPIGDPAERNVADQREDPSSILHLCRNLIQLRRRRTDLHAGSYVPVDAGSSAWAWRRGDATIVAVNCSDEPVRADLGPATVLLGSDPGREGERLPGESRLEPWEGVVVASA